MQNNKLLRYNSVSDHVTMVFVYAFTVFMVLVILIPLVFVVAASFSSPEALLSAKVFLWPVDFTLRGYKMIIEHEMLPTGFKNTFIYAILGTSINVVMTIPTPRAIRRTTPISSGSARWRISPSAAWPSCPPSTTSTCRRTTSSASRWTPSR